MTKHRSCVSGVKSLTLKLFLSVVVILPTTPGNGIAAEPSSIAAERLTIAGRQRMLAQGMAAKLCLIAQGVNKASSQGELYVMWNIFNWYHAGIRYGNPVLGVTAEVDSRVKESWASLDQKWSALKGLHEKQLDGKLLRRSEFDQAIATTQEVTDNASKLVASLRGAYADQLGPRGFGKALLIDLYERQRMLGHQITKQICLTTLDRNAAQDLTLLKDQIEIFVLSLDAFQNGRAEVGVPPPPSEEIRSRLLAARAIWQPMEPIVRGVANGQTISKQRLARLATAMDGFIVEMTAAINDLTAR